MAERGGADEIAKGVGVIRPLQSPAEAPRFEAAVFVGDIFHDGELIASRFFNACR